MKASHKRHLKRLAAFFALDAVLFGASNPASAPSWLIFIGFIAFCVSLYYLIYALISASALYGISVQRKRALSLYATLFIGVILALQSVGQLGPRDILVGMPLAVIGWFYNSYARTGRVQGG
jgi:hypothetical protein